LLCTGVRINCPYRAENLIHSFSGNNTDCSLNFIPKTKIEELLRGYRRILGTIYSPKEYYRRVIDFLKTHGPLRMAPS
jgi:hypothetical protein